MDESTFSDYVVARRPQLFRTACLLCGDPHRAEDVVQDALAGCGSGGGGPVPGRSMRLTWTA